VTLPVLLLLTASDIEEEQAMSRLKKGHQKPLIEEEQAMPRLKNGHQNPLIEEEQAMSRLKKGHQILLTGSDDPFLTVT
jgi:uncharacterized protein YifE (UPF0438 family)